MIVDTLNAISVRPTVAREFFTATSRQLQTVGEQQGVQHIVTLSIVGIDRVPGPVSGACRLCCCKDVAPTSSC